MIKRKQLGFFHPRTNTIFLQARVKVLDQTMSSGIDLRVVSSELGAKLKTKSIAERLVKGRRRRSTCFDAPDLLRAKASSQCLNRGTAVRQPCDQRAVDINNLFL